MPKLPTAVRRKIADWYRVREESSAADEFIEAQEKRRKSRLRLWECEECGKKLRVADDFLQAYHGHVDPDYPEREPQLFKFICRTPQLVIANDHGRIDRVPF